MRSVEWLNANRYRVYPFIEDSVLTLSGGSTMGNNVLLDFKLTSFERAACDVSLTSIDVTAVLLTFTFTYTGGDTFTLLIPVNSATPYITYKSVAGDWRVNAVFGEGILDLGVLTPGLYTLTNTPVIERALLNFQDIHRVNSVAADTGAQLKNSVLLEDGYNCALQFITDASTLRISAIRGSGAGLCCDAAPAGSIVCTDTLLRINGLAADDLGSFGISGGDGVIVAPDPTNHKIVVSSKSDLNDEQKCG